MAHVNNFVSEINNAYFSRHLFENNVWVAKSCVTVCFTYSSKVAILNTDILQGSLTTREGYGEVFKYDFVTNFLLSLTVKGFRKSVNIWWSYGQESGVLFFDSQCISRHMLADRQTDRQTDSTLLPIERRNKYLHMKSDINSYDKQQLTRDYQQQAAAAVRISSSCRTARWKHTVYKW